MWLNLEAYASSSTIASENLNYGYRRPEFAWHRFASAGSRE